MENLFYPIEQVAKQLKCDVKKIPSYIKLGILPPLLGNQRNIPLQIWPVAFWKAWYSEKAKAIIAGDIEG